VRYRERMARAPRIEFAGAIYHVMNRGDHLEPIFQDDRDRERFVETLAEGCESAGWVVHSFVLMPNHYHLLLETMRPTLVKGMQWLNATYTQRYNGRHRTHGHLFQGRYKALLVDGESGGYFLSVSDYVHLNPVRAKLVRTGEEFWAYRWSSAAWLAGKRPGRPKWLRFERVYAELGLDRWSRQTQREFADYLSRRAAQIAASEAQWKPIRRGWCLGGETFREAMKSRLAEIGRRPSRPDSWSGEAVEELEQHGAERLLAAAVQVLGYSNLGQMRGADRFLVAKFIRSRTKVPVAWLAERLGVRARGTLSNGLCLIAKRLDHDTALAQKWKQLGRL
jgi:putative transposase